MSTGDSSVEIAFGRPNVIEGTDDDGGGGDPTVYTDDFNRADAGTPGPGWDPQISMAIVSNTLRPAGIDNTVYARWATALPSADMYVEADVYINGGSDYLELAVRFNGTLGAGGSAYAGFARPEGGGVGFEIAKIMPGGYATVVQDTAEPHASTGRLRLEVEGSTLRLYWDDALKLTATDTSIPTGNYAGVVAGVSAIGSWYDNFETGALA